MARCEFACQAAENGTTYRKFGVHQRFLKVKHNCEIGRPVFPRERSGKKVFNRGLPASLRVQDDVRNGRGEGGQLDGWMPTPCRPSGHLCLQRGRGQHAQPIDASYTIRFQYSVSGTIHITQGWRLYGTEDPWHEGVISTMISCHAIHALDPRYTLNYTIDSATRSVAGAARWDCLTVFVLLEIFLAFRDLLWQSRRAEEKYPSN